ncbi:MAG TPA: gluconeogenesis factor YvcK family protein [Candidatus Acidoferrales bacterium]|nr:gluconeogenesis factor YvcK family protein [Candidatus Acidoferrales bacterium]
MSWPGKSRKQSIRIVALGGGTGLSMLLRGLKHHVASRPEELARPDKYPIADLVAVVTVTDDGGSSGRLRREYSILPPGDIRNCLVGLSEDEALLGRLFQYRFPVGRALAGHSFGNLFLTALTNVTGDFPEAVRFSGQVLAIRGRIYPSTTANVTLEALLEDGKRVRGETRISHSRRRIRRVKLVPSSARPLPEVLEAIREADLILMGPGSLYTSIIPNLLVRGVAEAIRKSRGKCVYISNLMTQPGETDGYSLTDHVRAVYEHAHEGLFDSVIVNRTRISADVLRRYRREGAEQVGAEPGDMRRMGISVISDDLLQSGQVVRHDHMRLARLILSKCGIALRR